MNAPPKGSCESVANVSEACVGKQLVKQLIEWMAQAATTAQCFLLTGRLYWLLYVVVKYHVCSVGAEFCWRTHTPMERRMNGAAISASPQTE